MAIEALAEQEPTEQNLRLMAVIDQDNSAEFGLTFSRVRLRYNPPIQRSDIEERAKLAATVATTACFLVQQGNSSVRELMLQFSTWDVDRIDT